MWWWTQSPCFGYLDDVLQLKMAFHTTPRYIRDNDVKYLYSGPRNGAGIKTDFHRSQLPGTLVDFLKYSKNRVKKFPAAPAFREYTSDEVNEVVSRVQDDTRFKRQGCARKISDIFNDMPPLSRSQTNVHEIDMRLLQPTVSSNIRKSMRRNRKSAFRLPEISCSCERFGVPMSKRYHPLYHGKTLMSFSSMFTMRLASRRSDRSSRSTGSDVTKSATPCSQCKQLIKEHHYIRETWSLFSFTWNY